MNQVNEGKELSSESTESPRPALEQDLVWRTGSAAEFLGMRRVEEIALSLAMNAEADFTRAAKGKGKYRPKETLRLAKAIAEALQSRDDRAVEIAEAVVTTDGTIDPVAELIAGAIRHEDGPVSTQDAASASPPH